MTVASVKKVNRTEDKLLEKRIANVAYLFISALQTLPSEKKQALITLPDDEFWLQIQREARTQVLINQTSVEKSEQEEYAENQLAFLKSLDNYEGVHKSSMVANIIKASVPTVIKKGEENKLIVLKWGAENLYPVFQFSVNERLSEHGMLKGVPDILARFKHTLSGVRKCNFFTRRIEMPKTGEKTSIIAVLRRGATEAEMAYFLNLAENLGTQSAL